MIAENCSGVECQRVAVACDICRVVCVRKHLSGTAGGDDNRLGVNKEIAFFFLIHGQRTHDGAVPAHESENGSAIQKGNSQIFSEF